MSTTDYSILSRVFTRSVLRDIIQKGQSDIYNEAVAQFIVQPESKTNGVNFDGLYAVLEKKYRNEYYYKNTLLNKLLLGVHSINTTTALTELQTAHAKGDFILINGKAVVYEIKTELDNFDRLDEQVYNYYKVFDHVSVVTCESNLSSLIQRFYDSPVGVCSISPKGAIQHMKKAAEYKAALNASDIFDTLRRQEYEEIIAKMKIPLPKVSSFDYYECCKNLISKQNINEVYALYLKILKARAKINSELFYSVPKSIKSISYFCNFSALEYKKLDYFLSHQYERG
ncbi:MULTISPECIES: sce7726 family protein [Oscillibacter]|uniref:sce7726 family protein n=1 Tax=Oscillibacter TaxID=459786 RepID=UPI0028A271CF|nr:sce7726 family protein [Oscillibacter sp.]